MLHAPKKSEKKKRYNDWSEFNPEEYAESYFVGGMSPEDKYIFEYIMKTLRRMEVPLRSWKRVADIGTGPNLYPGMALAPFVKPPSKGGKIDLHEYSPSNVAYLRSALAQKHRHSLPGGWWPQLERLIAEEDPYWRGAFRRLCRLAAVHEIDLFNIDRGIYDAVVAIFVAESMTDDRDVCERAVRHILNTAKPDAFIAIGFIIGSEGYPAGKGTLFPAVYLELEDIKQFFRGQKNMEVFEVPANAEMRPGYKGSALAIGRKA